jgi:hypothetical protein
MLELGDFVFYSELLSLEASDGFVVGSGAGDFETEGLFEVAVLSTEFFDTVLRRHGTSFCKR